MNLLSLHLPVGPIERERERKRERDK